MDCRADMKKARPKRAGLPSRSCLGLNSGSLLVAAEGVLHGVLDAADGVLHLAGDFIALALCFELGVAERLARGLLHAAFKVLGRTFHAIFISHGRLLLMDPRLATPAGFRSSAALETTPHRRWPHARMPELRAARLRLPDDAAPSSYGVRKGKVRHGRSTHRRARP